MLRHQTGILRIELLHAHVAAVEVLDALSEKLESEFVIHFGYLV
jgi:hypothetical protein